MQFHVEWEELVAFLARGDLVDRFVAICVAGSFIEASDSIVKDMFLPFVDLVVPRWLQDRKFMVLRSGDKGGPYETAQDAKADGAIVVSYGKAIRAGLTFLLQGLILFAVFRCLSKLKHLPGTAGAIGAQLDAALPTSRA